MGLFSSLKQLFSSTNMYQNLYPQEYDAAFKAADNAVLIDVRTPREFKGGHIPGAKNIDIMSPSFAGEVAKLDPSATYFINCQSGGRSARACSYFAQNGFQEPVNLKGGMISWMASRMPME